MAFLALSVLTETDLFLKSANDVGGTAHAAFAAMLCGALCDMLCNGILFELAVVVVVAFEAFRKLDEAVE
jgi:hypothetical protein